MELQVKFCKLIESYLNGQKQFVKELNVSSIISEVKYGVP